MKKMGVPARVRSGELGAGAAVCLPVLAVGRCVTCSKHELASQFIFYEGDSTLIESYRHTCAATSIVARMNPYLRELRAKGRAVDEEMITAAQLTRETREHNVKLEAALGAVLRAETAAQKAAKRLKTELSADPSTAHDSQTNTFYLARIV